MRRNGWRSAALIVPLFLSAAGCKKAAESGNLVLGVPTALGTIEGQDSLHAVELAVAEINAAGGVEIGGVKHKLEVASIDTREAEPGTPVNDALAAMEKLISEKKPAAIVVGAFRSEVLLPAMDMVAKGKLLYLCTIGMSPEFEKKIGAGYDKYKYAFRLGLNAPYLVESLGKTVAAIKAKAGYDKLYVLHQDLAWARGTANGLLKAAQAAGWTSVGVDPYPTGARDFSSSLTKASAAGAQLIVPIFDMPESGVLVKQARAMGTKALFAGFISPAAPGTAADAFGGEIEGLINLLFEPGAVPINTPRSKAFHEAFGKTYGPEAQKKLSGHGPGPSYDAVYVLAEAWKRAGKLDPDAVVAELEKTDAPGVIGRITFNKNHQVVYGEDPAKTAVSLAFQWRGGKRVIVHPPGAAEGTIELAAK